MAPPTIARAAPAKHKRPRQTVHSPADKDQSIVPIANITPMLMRAQGFASYND
jgi:hypothetical protein